MSKIEHFKVWGVYVLEGICPRAYVSRGGGGDKCLEGKCPGSVLSLPGSTRAYGFKIRPMPNMP